MKVRRSILLAASAALLMLAAACERRPLLISTNVADLRLTVHDTLGVGVVPCGELYEMRIYGESDGIYRGSSFVPPQGGQVNLPQGHYNMIVNRFDNSTILIDGTESFETLHAYTNSAPNSNKQYFNKLVQAVMTKAPEAIQNNSPEAWADFLNEDVVWEPDWFFVASHPSLDVPLRDTESPMIVIEEDAMPEVFPVRLAVKGVTGKRHISMVNAFLTGLSRGVFLSTGQSDFVPVTTNFSLHVGEDGEPMIGNFRIFSFVPDAVRKAGRTDLPESRNILFLSIYDTAGGSYLATFDVTDQCENSRNGIDVVINVEVELIFDVPEPVNAGGGFSPNVEDWNTIIYRIDL